MTYSKHIVGVRISINLLIIGIFAIVSVLFYIDAQKAAVTNARASFESAVLTSHAFLEEQGKLRIKESAEDAESKVRVYLQYHPEATVESMTVDPEFQKIASDHKVGKTGYITVVRANDTFIIAHPNPKIVGVRFTDIPAFKDPVFDEINAIVQRLLTPGVTNVEGYYNWLEADKRITRKYLYFLKTEKLTHDNVALAIDATTYLDEFNFSIEETRRIFEEQIVQLENALAQKFRIFMVVIVVTALCTTALSVGITLWLARLGKRRNG